MITVDERTSSLYGGDRMWRRAMTSMHMMEIIKNGSPNGGACDLSISLPGLTPGTVVMKMAMKGRNGPIR